MFELFLNPWAMAAGTILISSPIIIHLINRMRYRRVRWAAMEFLLKSQKRNRRRIIIEQIILLLLRILLVLLIGLLLARFLGRLNRQQQNTMHVVLLDNTPSTGDFHRGEGQFQIAFRQAKAAILDDIARPASEASTPQGIIVLPLADLSRPIQIDRLNPSSIEELRTQLADLEVSTLHVPLARGVEEAQAIFERYPQERRLLHVVSDFRARDWSGAPGESARQGFERLKSVKIETHLLDVADPVRSNTQRSVLYHDNLALVDFQPETRVVARYMPVEFNVGVANFSNSERKGVRVTVRVNGIERAEGSFTLASVPPGTVTTGNFMVSFDQLGANPVSVNLENEEAGLEIDNVRFAVVDVRERVPLLLVEGDPKTRNPPDGDGYYLHSLFSESTRGFDVWRVGTADLEKPFLERDVLDKDNKRKKVRLRLDDFPSIFLLNVDKFNEGVPEKLEKYVRNGGGIGFFLGGEAKPAAYNALYKDGEGLFPMPLADKPTDAQTDPGAKLIAMFSNPLPKIYPRQEAHPVFSRIYRDEKTRSLSRENNKYLVYANVDRYWPVPRAKWSPKPGVIDELMTLPNPRTISDYADQANRILDNLPVNDPTHAKYRESLERHRAIIKKALLQGGELYRLAAPLEQMLNDLGDPKDQSKPNLQEFWQRSDMADLREQMTRLLEVVRYGDPFLVGRVLGKGRVLACTSTAGSTWNDLPNGLSRIYYVMLMVEIQKYLASSTADSSLTLGTPLVLDLDPLRYETELQRFAPPKFDPSKGAGAVTPVDAGKQIGTATKEKLTFLFNEARQPGVYQFLLTRKEGAAPDGAAAPDLKARQETMAFAYNVDAIVESDLKRATSDDLESVAPGAPLHRPGDESLSTVLKQKKADLSESVWLYLLFLVVLVAEQAMAVRLSYHASGPEAAAR